MIDLLRLKELKDFILDEESEDSLKQLEKCNICNDCDSPDCNIKDLCKKYTPLSYNDETQLLLKDLFETIEYLLANNK